MANLAKFSVEHYDYDNNAFLCECSDGNDLMVTEQELCDHFDTDNLDRIPVMTTFDNAQGEPTERLQYVSLEAWQADNDLASTLALIIVNRQGAPVPKPAHEADFLPTAGLRNLLSQIAAKSIAA